MSAQCPLSVLASPDTRPQRVQRTSVSTANRYAPRSTAARRHPPSWGPRLRRACPAVCLRTTAGRPRPAPRAGGPPLRDASRPLRGLLIPEPNSTIFAVTASYTKHTAENRISCFGDLLPQNTNDFAVKSLFSLCSLIGFSLIPTPLWTLRRRRLDIPHIRYIRFPDTYARARAMRGTVRFSQYARDSEKSVCNVCDGPTRTGALPPWSSQPSPTTDPARCSRRCSALAISRWRTAECWRFRRRPTNGQSNTAGRLGPRSTNRDPDTLPQVVGEIGSALRELRRRSTSLNNAAR